jgi:hypothetical protein
MSHVVSWLFGDSQSAQQKLLEKQQADQAAVEAGQAKLRSGGGAGLLAYTDSVGGAAGTAARGLNKLLSGAS